MARKRLVLTVHHRGNRPEAVVRDLVRNELPHEDIIAVIEGVVGVPEQQPIQLDQFGGVVSVGMVPKVLGEQDMARRVAAPAVAGILGAGPAPGRGVPVRG